MSAGPASRGNSAGNVAEPEVQQVHQLGGLAGALHQLREQGCQERGGGQAAAANTEEHYLQMYLNEELETVSCLKYWEKQDRDFGGHKVKGALCRLARFGLIPYLLL